TVVTSGGSPVATSKTLSVTLSNPMPGSTALGTRRSVALQLVGGPDLLLTSLTAPAAGGAGQPIAASSTARNQGGPGSVAPPFRIGFFLSPPGAAPGTGLLIGNRSVPGLAGNVSASASTVLTIPAGTAAGTYVLSALADADNVISEWDETNNGLA